MLQATPRRLGGELWGWYDPASCARSAGPAPTWCRSQATDEAVEAFAAEARRHGRHCSSIVGPAGAVLGAVAPPAAVLGPGPGRAGAPAADGDWATRRRSRPTRRCGRPRRRTWTCCCRPASRCSPRRSATRRWPPTAGRCTARRWPGWWPPAGPSSRIDDRAERSGGGVQGRARVGHRATAVQVQGVWVNPRYRGARARGPGDGRRRAASCSARSRRWSRCTSTATTPRGARLPTRRLHRGRHLRHHPVLTARAAARRRSATA